MSRSPTTPFYEPFPPEKGPEIRGPDPVHAAAYRGAVTAADAYRATRAAVRRDREVLRVGNRFLKADRYREVAFLAVGNAAVSQALAVADGLGEAVTQGLVVGPQAPPPELPFHHRALPAGWPGETDPQAIIGDIRELAAGLTDRDLFLVLLSPGSLAALALPPPGTNGAEWAGWLRRLHEAGRPGADLARAVRVLGDGLVGGRLAAATPADVETLIVERGEGGLLIGGGPTRAVDDDERVQLRAQLAPGDARAAWDRAVGGPPADPATNRALRAGVSRPVVVAGPADALRGAADAVGDRGWTPRLAGIALPGTPLAVADGLVARAEQMLAQNLGTIEALERQGLVAFGTTTFELPEGVDTRPAIATFLRTASERVTRREETVGAFSTAGAAGGEPPGAVTGAGPTPGAPAVLRGMGMRLGITDVGCLLAVQIPVKRANAR